MAAVVLSALSCPAVAMAGDLRPDRRVAAYDECLMIAAVRASYTPAANEQIFDIARAACAKARVQATLGNINQRVALDAADAQKAVNLPNWVDRLRERRRTLEALYGTSGATPR